MNIRLNELLKHRYCIMGIASIWILIFHSDLIIPTVWGGWFVKDIGYGGVDLFFFVSGIGCYYSLCKDSDLFRFILRRIKRVLPVYFVTLSLSIIIRLLFGTDITLQSVLGNILCVQYILNNGWTFHWYVSAMWLMYFLAPFFKSLVDRVEKKKDLIVIVTFLCVFSFPFWNTQNLIIIVTRIPIFFIGLYIGKLCQKEYIISKKMLIVEFIVMMIGLSSLFVFYRKYPDLLWGYGLYWYPFILITPPLCLFLALIIEKVKILQKLEIVGKNSFEVYLINGEIFFILRNSNLLGDNTRINNLYWIIASLLTIPCCILINLLLRHTVYKIKRLEER